MQVLKPEYQERADLFELNYGDHGCTCHLGFPPCVYCTHEDNPLNFEGISEAWEDRLVSEVRKAAKRW